jgi:hypothetical protein
MSTQLANLYIIHWIDVKHGFPVRVMIAQWRLMALIFATSYTFAENYAH